MHITCGSQSVNAIRSLCFFSWIPVTFEMYYIVGPDDRQAYTRSQWGHAYDIEPFVCLETPYQFYAAGGTATRLCRDGTGVSVDNGDGKSVQPAKRIRQETLQTLVDDKDDDFFLPFPDLIQDVEQQDKLGGLLQDILQHMQIIA